MFFTVLASVAYLAVALGYVACSWQFLPVAGRTKEQELTEQQLTIDWANHYRYSRLYKRPSTTMEEYFANEKDLSAKRAHDRLVAYQRCFLAPVWPLLLVADVTRSYKKAEWEARPYIMQQAAEQLRAANEFRVQLDAAEADARNTLEESLQMMARLGELGMSSSSTMKGSGAGARPPSASQSFWHANKN